MLGCAFAQWKGANSPSPTRRRKRIATLKVWSRNLWRILPRFLVFATDILDRLSLIFTAATGLFQSAATNASGKTIPFHRRGFTKTKQRLRPIPRPDPKRQRLAGGGLMRQ